MQNTHNIDRLAGSLIDLMSVLNSPQRDEVLLRAAGVKLDRALFPLLVALEARGPQVVAALADLVGRDHTTISRQLAKLESLKLVRRHAGETDRRQTTAHLTVNGRKTVRKIALARHSLLAKALADWSEPDRKTFADLTRRFADSLLASGKK